MNQSQSKVNWRNLNVNRDRKYEHIVQKLVEDRETGIFNYNKDLMVFAAMIGHCFNKKLPLSSDKIPITLGTYSSTEEDGFIYLLALMENRNAKCLKDQSLQDSIKIFEEYCNGGLDLINDWFQSNPGDLMKIETLEKKLLDQMDRNDKSNLQINNDDIDVDF
ncbi:DNA phosphorothioation-associated protein 4 [Acinetobacter terrae]|uniref:DNA phosphorothioation-associated protein 4 n=1 Tax=Acinetobacter terrae TaxID=2731247 RepID=UPI000A353D95|nr:DNA phosphorothioation-associated protein 4 [Acinetobacter terrae]OTG78524.1 DNA phosphorothioation-associated protein 4 [Acinetobacter terrae]